MIEVMDRSEFLRVATPYVDGYVRAGHIDEHLSTIDSVTLTGGAGVGKDFIRQGTGYDRVVGWTTRDMRPGELEGIDYRFIHAGYEDLLALIEANGVVQLAVGSDGENIYGSFVEDYPKDSRCIFDVVPKTAREFRTMPFRSVRNFYITPELFGAWQMQWTERGDGTDVDDHQKRLFEAQRSLETCLDDDEFYFVVNDGKSDHAVRVIRQAVEEGVCDLDAQRRARRIGYTILRDIEDAIEIL